MAAPSINLSDLHFSRVTGPTRNIDQFSDRFLVRPRDVFGTNSASRYSSLNVSGTSTVTLGSNVASFVGVSAGSAALQAPEIPQVPYCFAEITVETVSDATPFVGFVSDKTTDRIWVYCLTGTQLGIDTIVNGVAVSGSAFVTPVPPYTLRCVVCWPEVWVYLSDVNGDRPIKYITISTGVDLRMANKWSASWKPTFGVDRNANGYATMSMFRAGYASGAGTRDFKVVTYKDGRPFRRGSEIFFMATNPLGGDWRTNATTVLSIDTARNYAPKIVSLLYFNISSTDYGNPTATKDKVTNMAGGCVSVDPDSGRWTIMPNSWGLEDATNGIHLWIAETNKDPTCGDKVLFLDAYQISVTGSLTSEYDEHVRYNPANGLYSMVYARTNLVSGWTTYYAALATGTSRSAMKYVAQDATVEAEGLNLCKVGGVWYATSGGTGGPHWWRQDETGLTPVTGPTVTLTGTGVSFSGFGSHCNIVPIDQPDGTTKYVMVLFSDSQLLGANATKGELVVMVAAETPVGSEFADSLLPPYADPARTVQLRADLERTGGKLQLIDAKTTNLPASPAAVGSQMGLQDAAITAAKFAADSITAAAVKPDAVTKIAGGTLADPSKKLLTDELGQVTPVYSPGSLTSPFDVTPETPGGHSYGAMLVDVFTNADAKTSTRSAPGDEMTLTTAYDRAKEAASATEVASAIGGGGLTDEQGAQLAAIAKIVQTK